LKRSLRLRNINQLKLQKGKAANSRECECGTCETTHRARGKGRGGKRRHGLEKREEMSLDSGGVQKRIIVGK